MQQRSTPGSIEDFQSVMREAVKNWHEALNGSTIDVPALQKQAKMYRRQRNLLLGILVSIGSAHVKRIMDRMAKGE